MIDVRQRVLAAAERLLQKRGPAGISTRAIAREAGCSDSALYKHFAGLDELLLALFKERLPSAGGFSQLALQVGVHTVEQNLTHVLEAGLGFVRGSMPIWMALMVDPELRAQYLQRLAGEGRGPHVPVEGIAAYLRAEQRLGRVRADADPLVTAELILSSLLQRVLLERMFDRAAGPDAKWASGVASAVARSCEPAPKPKRVRKR